MNAARTWLITGANSGLGLRMTTQLLEAGNISDTRPGDPDKVVAAMIASVEVEPAPLRLATGSDAFVNIQTVLKRRLAAIEAQEDLARSTDVEGDDVVVSLI